MRNTFFISDTHFGHANALGFTIDEQGTLMRPGFACVEDMDDYMVKQWNSVVREKDLIYHLGDVAIHKRELPTLSRLNGDKRLVKGNHDVHPDKEYLKYFKRVLGSWSFKGMVASHIPIHPSSLDRWGFNIHGHLHTSRVMKTTNPSGFHSITEEDPRYFNVSVEQLDYTPISIEEVRAITKDRFGSSYELRQ